MNQLHAAKHMQSKRQGLTSACRAASFFRFSFLGCCCSAPACPAVGAT